MGALGSFLSSFSESFTAAVIMWPFLSFLLTMPILAFLYHRDGRLRFASAAAAYCSVLYWLVSRSIRFQQAMRDQVSPMAFRPSSIRSISSLTS